MTVRKDALDALKTTLEGITVANGFLTDVANVEIGLRSFDEVTVADMPWIGIGFGDGAKTDRPGFIDTALPVHLHCYQSIAHTADADAEANASLDRDITRAIYATANLGVAGVIYCQVQQDASSTGAPESPNEGIAELYELVTIFMEEDII